MNSTRGSALVLKRFEVAQGIGRPETPVVVMEGRKAGVLSWILTLMGVDAATSLRVMPGGVEFRQGSLRGEESVTIPPRAIASVESGFSKPIEYLVAAAVIFVGCMAWAGVASTDRRSDHTLQMVLVLAGVCIPIVLAIAFALARTMFLVVETAGGSKHWIHVKPSVIEGVSVDLFKLRTIAAIVRDLANGNGSHAG